MAIQSSQLHSKIRQELRHANLFLTDTDYESPSRKWISGRFYNLYRSWLFKHNRDRWVEYSDCDNFAFMFMVFASLCHAKTMDARKRMGQTVYQGISVGVIFYKIEKTGGHAINFIHTEKGIEFFEPQTGKWVNLTDKERESSWFVVC